MPKLKCACGEALHYGDIPCKIEFKFMSDVEYDNYEGKIDSEELYMNMKSFLKCPHCKRIWIFWDGFDKPPQEYIVKV